MKNMNLFCGDSIKLMKSIPDNNIDLVLTDPSYNITRDNNFKTMSRWVLILDSENCLKKEIDYIIKNLNKI